MMNSCWFQIINFMMGVSWFHDESMLVLWRKATPKVWARSYPSPHTAAKAKFRLESKSDPSSATANASREPRRMAGIQWRRKAPSDHGVWANSFTYVPSFLFYNVLFCACARRMQSANCSHVAGQCHILFIFCSIYIHTPAYHSFIFPYLLNIHIE